MKIAWLNSNFHHWTGGNKFIFEVTKRLGKYCRIDVFSQTAEDRIKDMFLKEGIGFKTIGTASTYSMFFWLFLPLYLNRDIENLKTELDEYDVIVVSMFPMNIIAQRMKKKYVQYCFEPYVIFHDKQSISDWSFYRRGFAKLMRLLYAKQDIRATRNAERVLTTVEGVSKWIKRVYDRESLPTYVGVDTEFFRRKDSDDLIRLYSDRKIILHATDYTALKRSDFIVSAMPDIVRRFPNSLLLITHVFENKKVIKDLLNKIKRLGVERNVQVVGFVSIDDLPFYYSLADVCVYTGIGSGTSCNSLFVLESMACETPVVRTNFTNDEVVHGLSGYLFDPYNQHEMIEYIAKILSDSENARSMGVHARERVKSMYNWDSVVKKIFDTLNEVKNGAS